jgi:hypothetical protein
MVHIWCTQLIFRAIKFVNYFYTCISRAKKAMKRSVERHMQREGMAYTMAVFYALNQNSVVI